MIITNKQFPNYRKFEMTYEGRPLSMEVGKMAELCNAARRTASITSRSPWTSTKSSMPSAASPAASCAVKASPACRPFWPRA